MNKERVMFKAEEIEALKANLSFYRNELDMAIINMKLQSDTKSLFSKENNQIMKEVDDARARMCRLEKYLKTLHAEYEELLQITKVCQLELQRSMTDTKVPEPDSVSEEEYFSSIFEYIKSTLFLMKNLLKKSEQEYDENELKAYNLRNEYMVLNEKINVLNRQKVTLSLRCKNLLNPSKPPDQSAITNSENNGTENDFPVSGKESKSLRISFTDSNQNIKPQNLNKQHLSVPCSHDDKITYINHLLTSVRTDLLSKIHQMLVTKERRETTEDTTDEFMNPNSLTLNDLMDLIEITDQDSSDNIHLLENFIDVMFGVSAKLKSEKREFAVLSKEKKDLEYAIHCRKMFDETRFINGCPCGADVTFHKEILTQLQRTKECLESEVVDHETQLDNIKNVMNLLQDSDLDISLSDIEQMEDFI